MKLPESICESQQLSKVIKDKKKLSMKQLIMVITLQRYIERIRYSPMSRPNNHKIKIELG